MEIITNLIIHLIFVISLCKQVPRVRGKKNYARIPGDHNVA